MTLFLARGKRIYIRVKISFFTKSDCLFIKEDTKQIKYTVAIKRSWTK